MSAESTNYFKVWGHGSGSVFFFADNDEASVHWAYLGACNAAFANEQASLSVYRRPRLSGLWSGLPRVGEELSVGERIAALGMEVVP